MNSHDEPTQRKKKGKSHSKKTKIDQTDTDPSQDGRNYGLDRLNLGETAHELEIDSE